jgi:hypothetical protein
MMALKGKPRDMNKWREVVLDPNVRFAGGLTPSSTSRIDLLIPGSEKSCNYNGLQAGLNWHPTHCPPQNPNYFFRSMSVQGVSP